MADDRKRSNPVSVRFTDREMLDLSKQAASEDRPLAEYIHFILRRSLYGIVASADVDGHGLQSNSEHLK